MGRAGGALAAEKMSGLPTLCGKLEGAEGATFCLVRPFYLVWPFGPASDADRLPTRERDWTALTSCQQTQLF